MSTLSASDRDAVIRTIYGEARNQSEQGMMAVAWVIKNRTNDVRWPKTAESVVKQRWQFSSWNTNDPNYAKITSLKENDKWYIYLGHLVDQVWASPNDPTKGSVYYYAYKVMGQPKWWPTAVAESGGFVQIGDHNFAGKLKTSK